MPRKADAAGGRRGMAQPAVRVPRSPPRQPE